MFIPFFSFGIYFLEKKGVLLIGGKSKDFLVFRKDNFHCIQIVRNAHDNDILGFVEFKDGSIGSFSKDNKIKIWNF